MTIGAKVHSPASFNYAQALLRVAQRQGRDLSAMAEQANVLQEACRAERAKLRRFLEGPHIPTENKLDLIQKACAGKVDPLLCDLLKLLVARGRSRLMLDILDIFIDMVSSSKGIHYGRVETAAPLDEDQRDRLRATLEAFTHARLRIEYGVDPYLLGGVVFQYKDQLVDGSVRGKLNELRKRLDATHLS
ncbi:MAG: ATP synthase subunit delta [candidate division BRC1 bacterium ADurb.BinA364]|nr:MAG: ATP synthase subunit delta [candidate division BRC1 bacterium ADurb.BinA364]